MRISDWSSDVCSSDLISLSLFPPVAVSVENVGFANAPGAMTPEMATIDRLDVALQILPLLSGEIAIDRFILEKPVINLEVDEQGRPNWQLEDRKSTRLNSSH